jgi:hypothetical protein
MARSIQWDVHSGAETITRLPPGEPPLQGDGEKDANMSYTGEKITVANAEQFLR